MFDDQTLFHAHYFKAFSQSFSLEYWVEEDGHSLLHLMRCQAPSIKAKEPDNKSNKWKNNEGEMNLNSTRREYSDEGKLLKGINWIFEILIKA
jgi:hypothetical protein